jgi:DNA-binding response OmpR family regulator
MKCSAMRGRTVSLPQARQLQSGKIALIAEDEVLIRMSAAEALRDAGFEVVEASNAREALILLRARADLAVVITDIMMPGDVNGVGLIQAVRDEFPSIPVIATSAIRMKLEADMFLPKPYEPERLVASVRALLSQGAPT